MLLKYTATLTVVLCVAFVSADELESWGDGTQGTEFDWQQETNILTILHGNGLNYKFWVHDGSEEPGTGVIDNISVAPTATGDFTLLIQEEYGGPGALDWNEGNLQYAGGTSTVTGVKVAGLLSEPGKTVYIDVLDGSIDVAGSVDRLRIQEWASPSPAYIHIAGDVHGLLFFSSCAGDIVVDGDLLPVDIWGDLSGTVDVGGWGTAYVRGDVSGSIDIAGRGAASIDGDVLDSGDNHVCIGTLGSFECNNMELSGGPDGWLTFGPQEGTIDGDIFIYDTLRGVVRFRAPYEGLLWIGTIDAGPTGDPDMPYGGLYFEHGSTDLCLLIIRHWFKQGWIFATNAGEAAGTIAIYGEMGQESEATVARILTGTAATAGDVPTDFRWDVDVTGDVWPSEDCEPVIYTRGDLGGAGEVKCASALKAGATIRVDGDVTPGDGDTPIDVVHLHGEISVGGSLYGTIGLGFLRPSGCVTVSGQVASTGTVTVIHDLSGTLEVLGDFYGYIGALGSTMNGGRIHIHGSLHNGQVGHEIQVGAMQYGAAIAIDYDGWDDGDDWDPNATITIGYDVYDENTPTMHIWEITHCRGDMNNDRWLEAEDLEALSLAIEDLDAYEEEYPGLEGSVL